MDIFIGFLLGFLASLSVVAILELCKRPYLTIKAGSIADGQYGDNWPYRFVHVSVRNKRAYKLFSLVGDRSVAYSCQASIEVKSMATGEKTIKGNIAARWSGTPELVQPYKESPESNIGYIPDITKLPMGRKMDIIPDKNEEANASPAPVVSIIFILLGLKL